NEFEFPVNHCRAVIESMFPPMFRRFKSDLRDALKWPASGRRPRSRAPKKKAVEREEVVEEGEDEDEDEDEGRDEEPIELTPEVWEAAKSKVPEGMISVIWEEFCDNEKSEAKIANNAKCKAAREANVIRHTTGRCSYSNKKYKLSGIKVVPPNTTDKWLMGHECSDGSVHPSAVEKHPNNETKNKEQVFGRKGKEGIRGYSSHVSKKQGVIAEIAQSVINRREAENEMRLNSIQSEVSQVAGQVTAVATKVDAILNHLMKNAKGSANAFDSPAISVDTPSPEKGSTSVVGGHIGRLCSQVELLDNKGKVVALGTLDGETNCHGRQVKPHERKVYIEKIYDQTAVVWDGPQGDVYHTLSQLPLPNWLIWAELVRFDILSLPHDRLLRFYLLFSYHFEDLANCWC
ncbi:hypothetical protein MKW94_004288, partial [Papaver nudicaule]|nr:hypothetical protein [Papaver nudicaule]